jgi:hypothetical protein
MERLDNKIKPEVYFRGFTIVTNRLHVLNNLKFNIDYQ